MDEIIMQYLPEGLSISQFLTYFTEAEQSEIAGGAYSGDRAHELCKLARRRRYWGDRVLHYPEGAGFHEPDLRETK